MDVKKLEAFCVVADQGSFTAAAATLHMTQSAVSQQMSSFEREIGQDLIRRHPRGVSLTEVGTTLARRGRQILGDLAQLERDLTRIATPRTRVGLGLFTTAGAFLAPTVVHAFRERHPEIALEIRPCQPDELATQLRAGTIDVGLSWDYDFMARPLSALRRIHLLDDPMHAVLPSDHPMADGSRPVRLDELRSEPWVERVHAEPYRHVGTEMCRIAGFEPDVVFETEDYQSVQGLVAAGVGVAVVPRLALTTRRHDIVSRRIVEPGFLRRIEAVVLPTSTLSDPVSLMVDLLVEECRALATPPSAE
ncbi:LysR family transcriptional regulator [Pseudonocardia endophytica]|uniref:DNA-binding transcriptional LysR family regulator n=1 Tax=Pseudonocardia endophytica TaxID=401976 RepID=A0A4R1HL73_PSEEN|nr:LysR family transcriptional regulator [Pseudonocardia endophytica]TCK21841.1 DNA-binding transcriptional LysR family regulator [Pseudonocardia endophytica]